MREAAARLQVQRTFGLPEARHAARLHRRAGDLLAHGFEWTLLHGEPRNPMAHRYPLMPPCCDLELKGTQGRCTGNPVRRAAAQLLRKLVR